MSIRNKLFRKEAIKAKESQWLGSVLLSRPNSFTIFTIIFVMLGILIILFIIFGKYTKRTSVNGQLLPNLGLIYVYPSEPGVIEKKYVTDGQFISKGDPLYSISMLSFHENEDTNNMILEKIKLKKNLLIEQKNKSESLNHIEKSQIEKELFFLNEQMIKINASINDQKTRLYMAEENLKKYEYLLNKDYISLEEFQNKKDIYMQLSQSLKNYEKELINKSIEIKNKEATLSSLKKKQETEILDINKQATIIDQEKIDTESRRNLTVRALSSGIISSLNADIGQQVVPTRSLLTIIPSKSILEANLYVPSKNIGFIKIGQKVKIKYNSYSYQKFGQAIGTITYISGSTINIKDIANYENNKEINESSVFLVKAKLDKQNIRVYDKIQPLRVGMAVDANIMLETKRIYEWILDPLLTIVPKSQ